MNENTNNLVNYLVDKMALPTITSITKMLYLIELACVSSGKKPITEFKFIRYHYGPYDHQINTTLDSLVKREDIRQEIKYLSNGEPFVVYRSNMASFDYDGPNPDIVKEFTDNLGYLSPKQLTDLAYKTKPMTRIGATLGGTEHLGDSLNLSEA